MECREILKTDEEFRSLMLPPSRQEYEQLEQSLLLHGCKEPIFAWGSLILDGNKRFEICARHGLPYEVIPVPLRSRLEALSWICTAALSGKQLCSSYRRYLIGKKFMLELEIGQQCMPDNGNPHGNLFSKISICRVLGKKYGVHPRTIFVYRKYAAALDQIRSLHPDLAEGILRGSIRIQGDKLSEMAGGTVQDIEAFCRGLSPAAESDACFGGEAPDAAAPGKKRMRLPASAGAIKTMPGHDPDAGLNSLSLTMPSWVSSIRRAIDCLASEITTEDARRVLADELIVLLEASSALLSKINRGGAHAGRTPVHSQRPFRADSHQESCFKPAVPEEPFPWACQESRREF